MLLLKSITSDKSVDSASWDFTPRFLPQRINSSSLSFCIRVLLTQILAYMLDSLVRVSRRVDENHFIRIANNTNRRPYAIYYFVNRTALLSKPTNNIGNGPFPANRVSYRFLNLYHCISLRLNRKVNSLPFLRPSPMV